MGVGADEREDLTKCLRFISYSFRVLSIPSLPPSRPVGHVSHARSLVEDATDATDDDVSPTATGINLSKWRGRFASISALGFLAQCQMSIAICSTTLWDLLPEVSRGKSPDGAFVSDVRGPGANFGFCIF